MRNSKGFTLIELLIVIAIIAILAAVLIPNLLAARERAYDATALAWTRECVTAVETKRDPVTGKLDGLNGKKCAELIEKPLPAGVEQDGTVNLQNGDVDFTITGVKSRGTKTFGYDGSQITSN